MPHVMVDIEHQRTLPAYRLEHTIKVKSSVISPIATADISELLKPHSINQLLI